MALNGIFLLISLQVLVRIIYSSIFVIVIVLMIL